MADLKISQLPAATALAGTEVVPVVQSSTTKKATIDQILTPAAGKGVNFSANTPAAGMTSQLLNWYEEGTWTPTLTASTSNPTVTYTVQNGFYTRIGRQITATFIVQYSALSGGSGEVRFSLPFAGGTSEARGGALYVFGVTPPANTYSLCLEAVANGTSYVSPIFSVSGGAFVTATVTHLPIGVGSFRGQMTYFA